MYSNLMRYVLALALGCSHPAPAPEVAPKGPTPCEHASDAMVQLLLDRMPDKEHMPTEEADQFRNLIRERCEQDHWSAEATTCLRNMTKLDDAEACSKLMTEDQQAALVRAEMAKFPSPPGPQPGQGSASAEPATKPEGGD